MTQTMTRLPDTVSLHLRQNAALLLSVAVLWSASNYGYYAALGTFALENGYDDAPVLFAGYYLVWAGLAAIWFRKKLFSGVPVSRIAWQTSLTLPMLFALAAYVAVVLPLLPAVSHLKGPPNPPEFMFASAWYYLPKSAEILFQQVLIAAIVFTAAHSGYRLPVISIALACLFGGYHLLLSFEGFTSLYVGRFTAAATLFGLVAPYLYLRTTNGFRTAYGLHWGFYALDATITHFVLSA